MQFLLKIFQSSSNGGLYFLLNVQSSVEDFFCKKLGDELTKKTIILPSKGGDFMSKKIFVAMMLAFALVIAGGAVKAEVGEELR